MASQVRFPITNDDEANALLVEDPLALLLGMLLDQQVPMEWAFRAPFTLSQRLGERFNATDIAAMDPEDLVAVFCEKPALHRYPAAMARRAHAELAETGVEMKRQNLRRAYPTETAEEIDDRLRAWLGDRPLDAPGRVVRLSP